jgi:hypothetical protein
MPPDLPAPQTGRRPHEAIANGGSVLAPPGPLLNSRGSVRVPDKPPTVHEEIGIFSYYRRVY